MFHKIKKLLLYLNMKNFQNTNLIIINTFTNIISVTNKYLTLLK